MLFFTRFQFLTLHCVKLTDHVSCLLVCGLFQRRSLSLYLHSLNPSIFLLQPPSHLTPSLVPLWCSLILCYLKKQILEPSSNTRIPACYFRWKKWEINYPLISNELCGLCCLISCFLALFKYLSFHPESIEKKYFNL